MKRIDFFIFRSTEFELIIQKYFPPSKANEILVRDSNDFERKIYSSTPDTTMFGSGGLRVSGPTNPGLASIGGLGTSSSLNGVVVINSLDDEFLFKNKPNDLEDGELELSIHTGEDEDTDNDNTLNDA